ncbi:MAG: hypothetical protein ACAI43_25495 [Phycisphaerae bacterium]|nr:hypothetical protein [Tepidisphaeraceae bacterium]
MNVLNVAFALTVALALALAGLILGAWNPSRVDVLEPSASGLRALGAILVVGASLILLAAIAVVAVAVSRGRRWVLDGVPFGPELTRSELSGRNAPAGAGLSVQLASAKSDDVVVGGTHPGFTAWRSIAGVGGVRHPLDDADRGEDRGADEWVPPAGARGRGAPCH